MSLDGEHDEGKHDAPGTAEPQCAQCLRGALFNFTLFAAAPQLLYACYQALSTLEWIQALDPKGTNLMADILLLRAVISEAEV